MNLSQAEARAAVDAAQKQATAIGVQVTVAVVDDGGHLILLSRMDGAPALTPEIAEAKAVGAAVFGRSGDLLADTYEKRPGFFDAISEMARRPMIPGLGSLVIRRDGRLLGAIGVSGARPDQDLECAQAGLRAVVPSG